MFNVRYRSIDVLYITSRLSSQRRNDISPSNWPHLLTGHPVTSPLIKCVDAIEVERSTCKSRSPCRSKEEEEEEEEEEEKEEKELEEEEEEEEEEKGKEVEEEEEEERTNERTNERTKERTKERSREKQKDERSVEERVPSGSSGTTRSEDPSIMDVPHLLSAASHR
ncbi:hypothetical protein HZH66_013553 [Vespula vulgaris]|uniref:Uncharacterized protein n=1 Tax=Vespula vulgaris TaxID=7454 RepID=A0A834J6Q7_VESVU|nr:hypothetical protein HZH66_013553 [Vespula vulgaris]